MGCWWVCSCFCGPRSNGVLNSVMLFAMLTNQVPEKLPCGTGLVTGIALLLLIGLITTIATLAYNACSNSRR